MSELDEQALRDATTLVLDEMAHPHIDEATRLARVAVETYLVRVSCKAALPTPDAEAWVPMSDDDVAAMTARIKSGEADADEQARFAMTNMMFIIHQWASGAVDATSQQAYAAALLHHAESVNALYRKAVSR